MTLKKWQWNDIPGFEGFYQINRQGFVRSLDRDVLCNDRWGGKCIKHMQGCLLKPGLASHGYYTVSLRGVSYCLHILIMMAFVGPCPEGMEVLHADGNKLNNILSNLRYGTREENLADSAKHGTKVMGEGYPTAKLTDEAAREIRKLHYVVSQSELAKHYGVSPAAIQAVHDGRTWKHV